MLLAAHRVLKYATNVYSFMYVRKCVCHDYSNAMRHAAQRTSHLQAAALYLAWHFAWNAFCPFKCIHLLTVLRQPYLWQSETQARTEKNTHTKNVNVFAVIQQSVCLNVSIIVADQRRRRNTTYS